MRDESEVHATVSFGGADVSTFAPDAAANMLTVLQIKPDPEPYTPIPKNEKRNMKLWILNRSLDFIQGVNTRLELRNPVPLISATKPATPGAAVWRFVLKGFESCTLHLNL